MAAVGLLYNGGGLWSVPRSARGGPGAAGPLIMDTALPCRVGGLDGLK